MFPRGDLMVCIIDDREDVWNYARNLVCVQPYVYFKNTGDINDPSLLQSKPGQTQRKRKLSDNQIEKNGDELNELESGELKISSKNLTENTSEGDKQHSEDSSDSRINEQVKKDAKTKNTKMNKNTANEITENRDADEDRDDYLIYLEDILRKIHDEYYRIYEERLKERQENSQSVPFNPNDVNESDLPDVKKVLPMIKSRVLENTAITFSGVVPTGYDLKKQRCYLMAKSLGAKINEHLVLKTEPDEESFEKVAKVKNNKYEYNFASDSFSESSGADSSSSEENETKSKKRYTTHLVAAKYGTSKVHEALKSKPPIHVVTPEWLISSNYRWTRCDENKFKLTKEYDYKNCAFHNEYNMHQKYSVSTNKLKTSSQMTVVTTKRGTTTTIVKKSMEVEEELNSRNSKSIKEDLEMLTKMDKNFFDVMDKEVDDELDDECEEDEDETKGGGENSNSKNSSTEEDANDDDDDDNDDDDDGVPVVKKLKNEKIQSPSSSSSTSNNDSDDSNGSIDDEMIQALERDFENGLD